MKKILISSLMLCSVICRGQLNKIDTIFSGDTTFIKHLYATECYYTLPPSYGGYKLMSADTIIPKKDSIACCTIFADTSFFDNEPTTGFIYSPGVQWTENKKQDSIVKIIIEGDTMEAVRNLLEYCTQEKNENDNAYAILSMINLNALKKIFKSYEFNYYVNEYKKEVKKNKKARLKKFGAY